MAKTADIVNLDETMRPVFKGEILLCEDNEVNRHVFKSHITKLGLYIVFAENGKKGVDIVASRIENGQKPFGLIFMDIHMPVMDGLEAADELVRLGCETTIVALTSNVTEADRQTYKEHGMSDALSKPYSTLELWALLHKYFTPIGYENISGEEALCEEEKRRRKLFTTFALKNQNTFSEISAAIEEGDIKLAHRLAHTLRGLAGLMGKTALQEAGREVELSLAGGSAESLSQKQMQALKAELEKVLKELNQYISKSPAKERALDKERAAILFNKLKQLLESDDASCQELIDDLKMVPETDVLISQIEEYEFEQALETLCGLGKTLGV